MTGRLGPRPLPLHLATAMATWSSSLAALPMSKAGLLPWRPEIAPAARALAAELASAPSEALASAVAREAGRRFDSLTSAILRYRNAPPRRIPEPVPEIWRAGSTRLLDYGVLSTAPHVPALFVPSLVNRAYVLDLLPERSFLRDLASLGIRPLLLDWGEPGPEERRFDLRAYVERLERAFDISAEAAGGRPAVVGYCMGGVLAVALACRRPQAPAALALLATPWDFHADQPEQALLAASCVDIFDPALEALGELPVDVLQTLFWTLDPQQAIRKFRSFAAIEEGSPAAERFVALEDWVNDGVPLAAPVARECLGGWYGRNATGCGRWDVGGSIVDPAGIECPVLVVVPHRDRIVPPASATALAAAIPGSDLLRPLAGHIGMVVGARAHREVTVPLRDWLLRQQI